MRTPEQGADTIVYLASSPEAERMSGEHLIDRGLTRAAPRRGRAEEAVGSERGAHQPQGSVVELAGFVKSI
jgi:hypothetical protein